MTHRIIEKNKKIYLKYNEFRKKFFSELSPRDSEIILYLLPWLLSVNHPKCPGYVANLKHLFRIYNIDNENEIRRREPTFKRIFGIKENSSLLVPPPEYLVIQGLYTIGSVGSVSQTSVSDCDIWVCYDKKKYKKTSFVQLNQKINLIKDWMDINLKIPIFFFLSDVTDIKNSNFGNLSSESSGSAQKNVLKEEFYRTSILICGRIPLWWVCYDHDKKIDYNQVASEIHTISNMNGFIDLGNLEKVERNEYFGAALWQIYKSITSPLKSINKLIHLKMLLEAPQQRQICYSFREAVLSKQENKNFPDSSIFAMIPILDYYQKKHPNTLNFLLGCFYMRCEINPYNKRYTLKKQMAEELFAKFPISIKTRNHLGNFDSWEFNSQVKFGNRFFNLLVQIYKEISTEHKGIVSDINKQDLTILGRKLSAIYSKKENKIPIIQKISNSLNLSKIIICSDKEGWKIYSGTKNKQPIISKENIIYNLAYIVWNNLFDANKVNMIPNSSSVTLQEIINLCMKLKSFFETREISDVDYQNYLKKEYITKLLVIVSFEKSPWEKDINDFCVVYLNSWGELFVKKFNSAPKLQSFFKTLSKENVDIIKNYYIQRNCTSYEKIIARTKKCLSFEENFSISQPKVSKDSSKIQVDIDRRLRIIQKYISKMPSLPTTVTKVIEVCNRPTTSPNDLNRVISLDPVLTGQVLKLVNSAYYYLFNKVTSLTRAIIMLGLNTVKNLVLSKAIFEIMGDNKSFQALSMEDFWTHSICVGVTAKSLAAIKGIPLTGLEEYFVSGLLHDLGKIPLNNRFSEEYSIVIEAVRQKNEPFHEAEYSIFGMDHCMVGRMISEKWSLNETINDSLCYHHNPDETHEENRKLVETIALADTYANALFSDSFEDAIKDNILLNEQLKRVGISSQMLYNLRDTVLNEIEKAKVFLQPSQKG